MTAPDRNRQPAAASTPSGGAGHELVERIRAGDERAFTEMVREYHAPLCSYAYRLVRDATAVEELVQDVLFRVWQGRNSWTLRSDGTVTAYLYAAVRNAAFRHLRHERVVVRVHGDAGTRGDALAMSTPPVDAETAACAADLERAYHAAVAALPARCREIFVLRRAHGLSIADVARVTGLSPKTVEGHTANALRSLRQKLRDWLA